MPLPNQRLRRDHPRPPAQPGERRGGQIFVVEPAPAIRIQAREKLAAYQLTLADLPVVAVDQRQPQQALYGEGGCRPSGCQRFSCFSASDL